MTRAEAETILRRWGWTPERIAALAPGVAEFIAEDVPRDKAFIAAALAAVPAVKATSAGPSRRDRALAEIRRMALGDKPVAVPLAPGALKAALENIEQSRRTTP